MALMARPLKNYSFLRFPNLVGVNVSVEHDVEAEPVGDDEQRVPGQEPEERLHYLQHSKRIQ